MPPTRHRIHRQVFELTVRDDAAAIHIQDRIAGLQSTGVSPLLGKVFDTAAAAVPDHVPLRIERLTVDLGTLDSGHLEAELRSRLQRVLPGSLERALAEQSAPVHDPSEPVGRHSSFSLVAQFLASAQLPWWADPAEPAQLERTLKELLDSSTDVATTGWRRLFADPVAAHRAASHLSSRTLGRWVDRLSPGRGRDARLILSGLVRDLAKQKRRAVATEIWAAVLQTAAGDNPPRRAFWREIFSRLAMDNGLGMREQLTALPARGAAAQLMASLLSELPAASCDVPASLEERLQRLADRWPAAAGLFERLRRLLDSESLQTGTAHGQAIATFCSALEASHTAAVIPALATLLRQLGQPHLTSSSRLSQAVRHWAEQDRAEQDTRINGEALTALLRAPEPKPRMAKEAVGEEGLSIINAGLVLLWPFLKTFFTRLELLEDGTFRNRAARDNAVALLHFLATGEPDAPEYQLPLNKLLCGLDPDTPWRVEQPPDPAALAECDTLLEAFITGAPNLGKLSHEGLRSSFLLRRGILRAEPDGWRLRVERETYDLLLDRLPWPVSLIRLPWMAGPLQVDW